MKCAICKNGDLEPGHATVTLSRGDSTVVIKGVPADICDNCAEYYLTEDVARRVYAVADAAVRTGAEVQVLRYAA
jgi:YgiT-type zinc finger domain-containing protein